ncbi:MAG: mechanosensitive ion channel family protein [Chitinophagales bacterium]|nr:mechanosensitive ion channel family protein [Chitinophagales bacterium]
MNDFLQQVWWDNTVKSYLVVLGILLFLLLIKRFVSRYFAGLVSRVINRRWKNVERLSFVNLIAHPLYIFLTILIALVSLHKLKFPQQLNIEIYDFTLLQVFHKLGRLILIIAFIRLLLRIIDFFAIVLGRRAELTPDPADNQLVVFFKDFFKAVIVIAGILMIMSFVFDLNVGSFLTGLSIMGAAIALALRESLENLIASFIIFFDKPFTTGDFVKVQNFSGTIEKIGLRSTRIRTVPTSYISVPNKQMVDTIIDNISLSKQTRGELRLEVELSTSSEKLEQLLSGIRSILKNEKIQNYQLVLDAITGNSFKINADYYTAPLSLADFNAFKEMVNMSVLKLMESLKINMAGASTIVSLTGKQ